MPYTGYTIVVPDLFRAELEKIRKRGFARSVDETEIGMSSLAVPVRSSVNGPVVAAISMVGPTLRVAGDTESSNVATLQAGSAPPHRTTRNRRLPLATPPPLT